MVIIVRNRDIGQMVVHEIDRMDGVTWLAFTTEAGDLYANIYDDGRIEVTDPAYPRLRYNVERFRPLFMEALSVAHSQNQTGTDA